MARIHFGGCETDEIDSLYQLEKCQKFLSVKVHQEKLSTIDGWVG
jgi:hypothetical protein